MITNKFDVTLWPFGSNGLQVRTVTTPSDWETDEHGAGYIFSALNEIFEYGQNDFQPMPIRSVSVGDIIQFGDDYFIVAMTGFRKVEKGYVPTEKERKGIVNS